VLGVAQGEGSGGIALLAAIFNANFPDALWVPRRCARKAAPRVSS
jgi:hypothetical protein